MGPSNLLRMALRVYCELLTEVFEEEDKSQLVLKTAGR